MKKGTAKKDATKKKAVKKTVKKVIEDLAKTRKPDGRNRQWETKQYVPSERDLAWYYQWAVEHRRQTEIAANAGQGVTRQTVCIAVHAVAEWIRLEVFDEILETRHRQTATLENMVAEALQAWQKSKEIGVTITTETEDDPTQVTAKGAAGVVKTKRQEKFQTGDASYLGEARAAMADIRKIWGVDKPLKVEVTSGGTGEGLERVCGLTPAQAIRNQAKAMLEAAEKLEQ